MKAVCLTSGGLDSATCMAIAKDEGRKIYSLSILYGQRHVYEITAAKRVSSYFGAQKHMLLNIDLEKIGASSLIDHTIKIPITPILNSESMEGNKSNEPNVPSTYVPARNLIFLSLAVAWAEAIGAGEIFIGANAIDYSGYPDCRGKFLKSFEDTARLGTKAGLIEDRPIRVRAPLLFMSKAEIIETGLGLGVDFSITSSCYQPDSKGRPCGRCHSCQLRLKGFKGAGVPDPLEYPRRTRRTQSD